MGAWDRFSEWLSALLVASLVWLNGALTPVAPDAAGSEPVPATTAPTLTLAWAQDESAPPIEQVGEGQSGDVESLDESAAQSEEAPADGEAQDTAGTDEDVELLDQGAPPAVQQETQAPVTETAPPIDTSYVAPADAVAVDAGVYAAPATTGPALPEGFGTGRVHVATGQAGFPPGLEDCHVGAVTGRAYVGVDCGDGDSFVGHAPSFAEFPFVVDENFPFGDQGAPGAETQEPSPTGNDGDVLVAAGGQNSNSAGDETTETVLETSSNTSVQYEQRAKNREARVHVEGKKSGAKSSQKADKEDDDEDADSGDDNNDDDSVSAEQKSEKSKHKKSKKGKKRHNDKKDRRKSTKDKN